MIKSKHIKKFILYFLTALILSFSFVFIYSYSFNIVNSFNGTFRDYMFDFRGEVEHKNNVVIIDIDEKSLDKIGQWPWGRDTLSELITTLTNTGAAAIGMDIVFAEEDASSPHKVLKDLNMSVNGIRNNDEIFANTIASSPTILAYQFQIDGEDYLKQGTINIPAIVVEKNKQSDDEYILKAKGVILNTPNLQNSSYSSGFVNNIPDSSGMIRSVPLMIQYDDQMYPSLSLELIRASLGINKILINYAQKGVESFSLGDFHIPTDRFGRLIINFRGGSKTFKYISAFDILDDNFDIKDIEGKVILIGTSAAGLKDLRAMPFDNVYPGVEVHANVIDNIIEQDFLTKASSTDDINIIIMIVSIFLTVFLVTYSPFWLNPFVMVLNSAVVTYIVYIFLFEHKIVLDLFLPLFAIFLSTIMVTFLDYLFEIKKEQQIKKKFASKVSEGVMKSLLEDIDNNEFHAIQREVTIFFSDVRNFTNISEAAKDAKNIIEFLNIYMDPMTQIIIENKGTVDKYIGDAIMAYWNAPTKVDNHADLAVKTAIEQLYEVKKLNVKIKNDPKFSDICQMAQKNKTEVLDIGIGINTGSAIVGEMGSSIRSDYTVIGDAINLGARLESLCKYYDSKLNISSFTKEQLNGEYIFRFLDLVRVKGKNEAVEIWQIHDLDSDTDNVLYDVSNEQIKKELENYHKAISLYKQENFKEASVILYDINSRTDKTNNKIYQIYIDRCLYYMKNSPIDFDGIFEHTTKG